MVNRVPAGDDIRSNMVRGGAAKETELTAREREICLAIGPELKRRGLLFVGIDVIDGYLTEINVTSPTGIRAVKRLGGPDLAVAIWDAIEAKLRQAIAFLEQPSGLVIAGPRGNIPFMSYANAPAVERRSRAARAAPPPKGVDRAKLLDKLEILHERHSGDAAAFRRAAIDALQAALASGRSEARKALEEGGTGRACAEG